MKYRVIGTDPGTRRSVSVLSLGAMLMGTRTDASPELTLVAYSPLLSGAYVRADRPLGPEFDHAGTSARLEALRSVARETGATVNQVVLA